MKSKPIKGKLKEIESVISEFKNVSSSFFSLLGEKSVPGNKIHSIISDIVKAKKEENRERVNGSLSVPRFTALKKGTGKTHMTLEEAELLLEAIKKYFEIE